MTPSAGRKEREVVNEPLVGYTREGIPVTDHALCTLSFTIFSCGWTEFKPGVSLAIDFNKTANFRKRPYIALELFGLLIQSGWLF